MVKIKPRLPKGTRDFLPDEVLKREYVFDIVREVFHIFGFEPLETPVMEMRDTLMGKYGEDAEKLIYHAQHPGGKEELALRYDLTVPLARVVAQHENEIRFPFKRYQLSPVWRAERPQRGRYREFYQCDADIVGVEGMAADAELISLVATVLNRLGFEKYTIKINNRKLLTGMGQYSGVDDDMLGELYRSVDKFDKIGAEGVQREFAERGIPDEVVGRMMQLLQADHKGTENLDYVAGIMGDVPAAAEGIQELREMAEHMNALGISEDHYAFDYTMVRGLGYYTGPIFETVITDPDLGSISGGGRYDDLIGIFRRESLPTTGVSLGIERIIDLMDYFNLYPEGLGGTVVQVLVTLFSEETRQPATKLAAKLRRAGVNTELMMEDRKLGKQFAHADKKGIPIVAVMGPDEIEKDIVTVKRLRDGKEFTIPTDEASARVQELLAKE